MAFTGISKGGKNSGAAHQATTGKTPRESKLKTTEKKVTKASAKEPRPKVLEKIANKLLKRTKTAERKAKVATEGDTTAKTGAKWKKGDKAAVRERGNFLEE